MFSSIFLRFCLSERTISSHPRGLWVARRADVNVEARKKIVSMKRIVPPVASQPGRHCLSYPASFNTSAGKRWLHTQWATFQCKNLDNNTSISCSKTALKSLLSLRKQIPRWDETSVLWDWCAETGRLWIDSVCEENWRQVSVRFVFSFYCDERVSFPNVLPHPNISPQIKTRYRVHECVSPPVWSTFESVPAKTMVSVICLTN